MRQVLSETAAKESNTIVRNIHTGIMKIFKVIGMCFLALYFIVFSIQLMTAPIGLIWPLLAIQAETLTGTIAGILLTINYIFILFGLTST